MTAPPSVVRLALTLECCASTYEMFAGEPWQLDFAALTRRIAALYDNHRCLMPA